MKRWSLFLMLLLWGARAISQQNDTQRYVGLQFLNLTPGPTEGLDIIEKAIDDGCNLVAITIFWDEVYKSANATPDWRQYDAQMALIARKGVKAAIRVYIGRMQSRLEGYWTKKETMVDFLNRPVVETFGRTCFSFAAPGPVAKSYDFISEVCKRYNDYQKQGHILYVSFVNSPTQELGYHYETLLEGEFSKQYFTGFDYAEPALIAFNTWIQSKYRNIKKLNYHWGTKFADFKAMHPPSTSYTPLPTYRTRAGKDWYLFGHLQLKSYIDGAVKAIKSANESYKVISEYGAVNDNLSAMRGTLAFKDLEQSTDGTKVNSDPLWSHRWVFDIVRSNLPNKWLMSETFHNKAMYSDQALIRHFDESFEAGCKVVTMVVSVLDPTTRNVFANVANRWLNKPLTPIQTTANLSYRVTEALDSTVAKFEKEWDKLQKPVPQYVNVQLIEDLLMPDYWKPLTVNVLPTVINPLIERATKPKKNFSYTLPKDIFADPDGEIVKIEVTEKPAWLSFNQGVFSGVAPDQLGDNKVVLRATDDEGGTVQTNFNLKIVNVNVKPVVVKKLPNFETYYEQHIFYQFPGAIFDDPDGVIVRTEARGIRPWMTYTGKEFSAFPQEKGTFPITLRAYDDDSATVETTFEVKVINRPPVVKQLLPEKVIAQNKLFRFRISTSIFADPDGQIKRLEALEMPSWLSFNGIELTGMPPTLGTYRLKIRAYDDNGDWVETPFVIVVDTRANLNQPPVLRFKIPDAQLYVTQRFAYKISDSLFYDTNGYVDRLEFPNLPKWLTLKGNDLTGVAKEAGTYTVTIRAIDDDETATTTTFIITVRYPKLDLQLIKAGKVGTRQVIGNLTDGSVWSESAMPSRVTIYGFSEVLVKKMIFKLTGPYQRVVEAKRFPFTLFDEETGFAPIAGTYTLEASAYDDSIQVSSTRVKFTVKTTQPISNWQTYPNPFVDVCNIKLPEDMKTNRLTFRLVHSTGRVQPILTSHVNVVDHVAYLNLSNLQLAVGTYWVQVWEAEDLKQILKVVKQ